MTKKKKRSSLHPVDFHSLLPRFENPAYAANYGPSILYFLWLKNVVIVFYTILHAARKSRSDPAL